MTIPQSAECLRMLWQRSVELAKRLKPDLITLHRSMPVMNGLLTATRCVGTQRYRELGIESSDADSRRPPSPAPE